jgi:hypothetical protein
MGAYIYTRKNKTAKARLGTPYGKEVEIGLITYHSKPYTDEFVAPVKKREQKRLEGIEYTQYVVLEFKNGATVYEMEEGRKWSWDTPHIGLGEVGFLFLHQGIWIVANMQILDSIVAECSAFPSFIALATRHPNPTLMIDSPARLLLADAFDAWQQANNWWKGNSYHHKVYRREVPIVV